MEDPVTLPVAKLKATIKLNVTSVPLQMKQSTTAVKVSGLALGDYVKSWKSQNTKIARVDKKGKITAQKKTGSTYVIVTLASGKTAKIKITVQKSMVKTKKISGLIRTVTLKRKKRLTLKPVLVPMTSQEKITYTTSNSKVAPISSKGVITAKKAGTTKITVKSGKAKYNVTVKVK